MIKRFNNFFISGLLFAGFGLCMFSWTIYKVVDEKQFIAESLETEGFIADYIENEVPDSKGRLQKDYYPVIKFSDRKGNSHSFRSEVTMNYEVSIFIEAKESGFKSTLFKVPKVKIRYRTDNPDEARAARSFFDLWGNLIILAIISAAICFVGCALLWFDHERKSGETKHE